MKTYFTEKIEKIVCPFDFTVTAKDGLEYAAKLSRSLSARLTIFYVRPSIWPDDVYLYEDLNDSAESIHEFLEVVSKEVRDEFDIPCDYEFESTADTIAATIGAKSANYDLIVMGTNGADDLYQHIFGSNTYHVLGLAKCPVVMVPEGYLAGAPKTIVYAYDPETNPVFLVDQLEHLAGPLRAEIRALSLEEEPNSSDAERKMEILGETLAAKARKDINWSFEPIYAEEVVSTVNEYMKEHEADMLALSYHHRTLFEKLFHENVIKQISRIADYPVLVFWIRLPCDPIATKNFLLSCVKSKSPQSTVHSPRQSVETWTVDCGSWTVDCVLSNYKKDLPSIMYFPD